ncbi:MAG TPA: thermonuclease family protein [Dongiaceae bacterium]|nr:thermonuclease family protein [Dongiaceae bacterium]
MRPALSLILALSLGLAGAASAGAASDLFRWEIVAIKDGDTLAVELPGLPTSLNPIAVRVRSVDAPESGGRAKCPAERALARRATEFTRRAIAAAATVEFERPTWDKYGGRIDADVWVDGELLSARLIAAGLARRYDGGRRAGWC